MGHVAEAQPRNRHELFAQALRLTRAFAERDAAYLDAVFSGPGAASAVHSLLALLYQTWLDECAENGLDPRTHWDTRLAELMVLSATGEP